MVRRLRRLRRALTRSFFATHDGCESAGPVRPIANLRILIDRSLVLLDMRSTRYGHRAIGGRSRGRGHCPQLHKRAAAFHCFH